MPKPEFNHYDLKLLNPSFDSSLVDVVTELEHLRRLELGGTTPPLVFFQLKAIFHMLESLGSARIEGNHTTLADYVESKLDNSVSDQLLEMKNIESAMAFIEETVQEGDEITEYFIREIHGLTVNSLKRDGDDRPGAYRHKNVGIAQSSHLPPDHLKVPGYMKELIDFINSNDAKKYDLIKVAIAHHRFAWVHPFGNGNGRVVRLLTYALLIKYGFNVSVGGRVLNPTAVFCNDRDKYYEMLGVADSGRVDGIESWCIYVLEGILIELNKLDRLTDFGYLNKKILMPALQYAKSRNLITSIEFDILTITARAGVTKAADFNVTMEHLKASKRTYQIKKLVDNGMLLPLKEGARQYVVGFRNSYLVRGVIDALSEEGFIPASLNSL